MSIELKKATPVRLRDLALDEKWLQDKVEEDPSILGLGADVQLFRRERRQASGGRIDFVLNDTEQEYRYEVEIMLGTLDESHIIRTIEYWDIERQRYPDYDHRAVIVAEEITARFFNVIRLLNRAVPLIAIQLNAFTIDGAIVLHFTKVLDIYQETDAEIEPPGDPVDRRFWEKRASPMALTVVDQVVALIQDKIGPPRVTYNKNHIALGTTGTNFVWFHPPKAAAHCHIRVRPSEAAREGFIQTLSDVLPYVRPFRSDLITIKLSSKNVIDHRQMIEDVLRACEVESRKT